MRSRGEKDSNVGDNLPSFKPRIDSSRILSISRKFILIGLLGLFFVYIININERNQRRIASEQQTLMAQPTQKPSATQLRTSTPNQTKTQTSVTKIFDCDAFFQNTLAYSITTYNDDFLTVHPKEARGEYYIQSVEVIVGINNPTYKILAEVHSAVFCFSTNAEAEAFFEEVSGGVDRQLGNYEIANKRYYGSEKYQIWFIDLNIVVQIKGQGRYYREGTAVERETENQAIYLYQKIRSLPKVDSLPTGSLMEFLAVF